MKNNLTNNNIIINKNEIRRIDIIDSRLQPYRWDNNLINN
jgi:hypothetical protein